VALAPGTRLGAYEVVALLGVGGMGEVYRAHDSKLHRDVAIKILLELFAVDPERRQRFEREAQTVAALNHPGIVTVYSVESAGDLLFLTMELVEGKPLSDLIPSGGMSIGQILKLGIPLTDAVSAAHQRGITHRDLKPANVMVADEGRVKVLDFGLAKLKESEASEPASLPTQALTGEGRIVGTVAYMSPEQAEGKSIDHRTDVFSLGIILYEMATGQRPFKGDTSASIVASILRDSPASITELKPQMPRDLARIVRRCLVKDPEHRYQTVKDLRNDLEALKEDVDSGIVEAPAVAPLPAAPLRTRSAMVGAAIVVGVAALAIAAFTLLQNRRAAAPSAISFDAVKLARLTNTGRATLAAISPDGKYVVHVVDDAGAQSLWIRQVATASNVQIVPPADARYDGVAFSPDGNYVYYSTYPGSGGGNIAWLYQLPVLGGTPRRILEDIDSPVTFAPDAKRFAFLKGFTTAGETAVMVANVDGTGVKRLAVRKAPDNFPLSNLAWSPDGRVIAVPVNGESGGQRWMGIVAVDAETGAETRIGSKRWDAIGSVAWLGRDGLVLTAIDAGGSMQLWYVSNPGGEPRRVTNDLNNYDQLSVTADASALVTVQADRRSHLWVAPAADARRAKEITSGTSRFDGWPSWTPDGQIVYTSNASGNADIWIVDADGRGARQLTTDPGFDANAAVSPDGETIVFQSARGGTTIWKMNADGGNQVPLTPAGGTLPVISRDGRWVFYWSFAQPQRGVWRVPLSGGEAVRVVAEPTAGDDPARTTARATFVARAISPDGAALAGTFLDRTVRAFRTGLLSIERGDLVKTFGVRVGASGGLEFTADGRALMYADVKNGVWNVWSQPLDGGPAKQVTDFTTSGSIFGFSSSRDGRQLVVARGPVTSDVVLVANIHPAVR
jgi:Tol biopolymer transport system component